MKTPDMPDVSDAQGAASKASRHPVVQHGARVGYAASGLMHLVIAYIAIKLATGSGGGSADQSGAFGSIASAPGGKVMLWVCAVGLILLALWHLLESVLPGEEAKDRVKNVGTGVMYAAMGFAASKFAMGGGSSSSGQSKDFTAKAMSQPGGRWAVAILGLVVIGIGGYHVYKGVTKKFCEDLEEQPPGWVEKIAMVGFPAKGLALAIVGGLFVMAGVKKQTKDAGGLDSALKTVLEQPFGSIMLIVVAIGIALFGVYCFARAKYSKRD